MANDVLNSFDLDKELVSLKKEETLLIKEFQRIIDFFNRALLRKETIRVALMEKIIRSEKLRTEGFDKLKTVIRNIEIYDKNLEQIAKTQESHSSREVWLKIKYEEMLHSPSSSQILALATDESEIFGDTCQDLLSMTEDMHNLGKSTNREELMKCRQEYLQGLQGLFQKMDEELAELDLGREKQRRFSLAIKRKKDKAGKQEIALKKNYNLLVEDIKKKKIDLEVSVQEERALITEYRNLLQQIRSSVKKIGDIDGVMEKLNAFSEPLGPSGEYDSQAFHTSATLNSAQ